LKDHMLTPLMRQYYDIKDKYPDTLLLFQVGDFYELFFEDAQRAASVLGITLTQRGTTAQGEPIPLCGVPLHVLDNYLAKLVKAGFKVAICDQLEAARPGVKTIERGVTQVLTPGTLTDSRLLDDKAASYLCVIFSSQESLALLFAELLTGQLFVTQLESQDFKALETELSRFLPDEIVVPDNKFGKITAAKLQQLGYTVTLEQSHLHAQDVTEALSSWVALHAAQNTGALSDTLRSAFAVLYTYLKRNNERALGHLKQLSFYKPEDFLLLDAATQRNLELIQNTQDGTASSTLFAVLDKAVTAMGSRTLKKWLLRPLIKQELIEQRLDAVALLVADLTTREHLKTLLKQIGDIERIVGRIALRRAQLQDYVYLLRALEVVPRITQLLGVFADHTLLFSIKSKIADFGPLYTLLTQALNDDSTKEWSIKSGFNAELDRLRTLMEQGTQAVVALERKEQETTGISSLKIKFNGAHGYGIEVTKANTHLVPAHYLRIQTLVNRERYTTQELKDLEYDLARARTDSTMVEKELFEAIKKQVELYVSPLKKLAYALSYLDGLAALAEVAYNNNYVRPTFNKERNFTIVDGRHPVIEARLHNKFIPNSTEFNDTASLWVITGPNMGGKSTYLRQVALITIMAQMGSFVPAAQAHLSLVDRIFTRIGAADNVAEGKSTFLVEMEETAAICNQATPNSLVILDEVGRGTSTFDGLAIAQAVVEYIYTHVKARCLFATHYHELTVLAQQYPGIVLYYAASTKTPDGIVLLHKIVSGVADGSFGLEVAKLAQLPEAVLIRAREIAYELIAREQQLATHSVNTGKNKTVTVLADPSLVAQKISLLESRCAELDQRKHELEVYIEQQTKSREREHLLAQEIIQLDCDHLTAKQALDILWRLKESL
jgi:DNA mismatch repair protein MutS